MVFKCAPSANDLRDHHPESTEASPELWKQELQDLLDVLEVSYDCLQWASRSLNYPQGGLELDRLLVAGGDEQQAGCLSNVRVREQSSSYRHPTLSDPRDAGDAGEKALETLISGIIPQGELSSLIEAVVSCRNAVEMVGLLRGNDAQVFINAANEVQCHSSILGK